MTQTRVSNYGDPVSSTHVNWPRQYLLTPGVHDGLTLGISTTTPVALTIAAGVGLQPDGVLWREDAETVLSFTPPGAATNYTVVATHVDQAITHGVPVEYEIQSGLSATVTNGVVLGWIYHPGGGATLTAAMLSSAPDARADTLAQALLDTAELRLSAPFNVYSDVAGMGANVTFTGQTVANVLFDTTYFVVHQRVAKVAGPAGPETLVQHFPFYMRDWRPVAFDLYCNMPGASQLQLELRDTDLNVVAVTGSPISGPTTNWEWRTVTVDRNAGTFATNSPYELRITSRVDVGQQVDLAFVVARYWPYPT